MNFRNAGLVVGSVGVIGSAGFIGYWEGMETSPYKDIGGVWTVCYGETNVQMREYTKEECQEMLQERVAEFYHAVDVKVSYDIPLSTQIAFTSFAYNVGLGAFGNSTLLRKANSGDLVGACDQLEHWSYVGKMFVRGLNNRRKAEYALCISDLEK